MKKIERLVAEYPMKDQRGLQGLGVSSNGRSAGRPAGTTADAARIPIAQAAAATKTTTRSLEEIILVVVPCRSSADRSILSVARIPLDLTSLPVASRRVASRRAVAGAHTPTSLRRGLVRTVARIVTQLYGTCVPFFTEPFRIISFKKI